MLENLGTKNGDKKNMSFAQISPSLFKAYDISSKIIVCDYKVCDPSVVSNILICNTMYCMMEGQEILDHVTMPCLMHHIVRFGHVTSHNIGI